jgi:hypothetical protein
MSEPLMIALESLRAITSADDMRWLYTHAALALGQKPNLRGIKYREDAPNAQTRQVAQQISALPAADLKVVGLVADLLYAALRPQTDSARGQVQIKTVVKKFVEIDFKTGLPQIDDEGNEIWLTFNYYYAYIRLYAGKGDSDRKGENSSASTRIGAWAKAGAAGMWRLPWLTG